MKKANLYEFKDLAIEAQERVVVKETEAEVEFQLTFLAQELEKTRITESDYYEQLGCSKSYAESTGWFVPSCYYEHNKDVVDSNVQKQVSAGLYTKTGKWVQSL